MSGDRIREYEERLYALERELREKILGAHYEEADRISREISELKELLYRQGKELQRLRDYQAGEYPREQSPVSFPYAEKHGNDDTDDSTLDQLQKRISERNAEIARLKILMATLSAEQATAKAEESVQKAPSVQAEEKQEEIVYRERLTFAESYVLLSNRHKVFCDSLRSYAMKKSGAREYPAKYHLSVGNGQKVILKLTIKNGVCFALFRLEDERVRKIRRNATSDGAEVKIKETEISITDESALRVAKEMVDLRVLQLAEDVELQKQRAAERRKTTKSSPKGEK